MLDLSKFSEPAFISDGFRNWKKALDKFQDHEASSCHHIAIRQIQIHKSSAFIPIDCWLSQQIVDEQKNSRVCLKWIFTTVRYLARQGIAFRGHSSEDGNFHQLLLTNSEHIPALQQWMKRSTDFTSPQRQNEILELFAHAILRSLSQSVRQQQESYFSAIVDGSQDINGVAQESICIRHVDDELQPREDFIGFYEVPDSTGKTIASVLTDALIRLQLPLSSLRGQTYDGAANMSGQFNGCQAIIKKSQPLALYVHCGAHAVNLVASHAAEKIPLIRDALLWIQELGTFYRASSKYRQLFSRILTENEESEPSSHQIKQLCPTRWLTRCSAIQATLQQYSSILDSLEEASRDLGGDPASRASGLLCRFQAGSTLFALMLANEILTPLESLNKSLQSTKTSVSGMLQAVALVEKQLLHIRDSETFALVIAQTTAQIEELQIEPLCLPRRRQAPQRYSSTGSSYHAETVSDHYRPMFLECIDLARRGLNARFNSEDLLKYQSLENLLLCDEFDTAMVENHPDFYTASLKTELAMFRYQFSPMCCADAAATIRQMSPEVRRMFPQVERLVRLLLVSPASSCEAERSFSGLRRLLTWQRNTTSQKRLNHMAICHIHQDIIDNLDIDTLLNEFISRTEYRKKLFGKF